MVELQTAGQEAQTISREHANGEVFVADSLEAAYHICKGAGNVSLQEFGVLLELETIGKDIIASEQPKVVVNSDTEKAEPDKSPSRTTNIVPNIVNKETEKKRVLEDEFVEPLLAETPASHSQLEGELFAAETYHKLLNHTFEKVPEFIKPAPATRDLQIAPQAKPDEVAETTPTISLAVESLPVEGSPGAEEVTQSNIEPHAHKQTRVLVIDREPLSKEAIVAKIPMRKITTNAIHTISLEPVSPSGLKDDAVESTNAMGATAQQMNIAAVAQREAPPALVEPVKPPEWKNDKEDAIGYGFFEADEVVLLMEQLEQDSIDIEESWEVAPWALEPHKASTIHSSEWIIAEEHFFTMPELPAPTEQVESTMVELIAVIENPELEGSQRIHEILAEIIALPSQLTAESANNEETIQQNLTELFVELFKAAHIDATPELVKSFVKLTQMHYFEAIIKSAESKMDSDEAKYEIGTREFLHKLQQGLSAIKRAITNSYQIGKSILRLYVHGYAGTEGGTALVF